MTAASAIEPGPAALVATNTSGIVEHPGLDAGPYLIDEDGRPFVPTGAGGVVLGLTLGDSVFGFDADSASPAVSVVHTEPAARAALTAYSCLGNPVTVRTGRAAGARGTVLGKRGEQGQVLAWFPPDITAHLVPGDTLTVRALGQGAQLPGRAGALGGRLLNVDPAFLGGLGIDIGAASLTVRVRGVVGSKLIGNGIGRPAHQWDLDLQVTADTAAGIGLADLRIGDLVAVQHLDVRHNTGYRAGWVTVGVVTTTVSPRPGHGAGLMPILCVPDSVVHLEVQPIGHVGVTAALLTAAQ